MSSLISTVQILICFQCLLFIGFLILGKRLHHPANRYLLAILVVLGVQMALNLLETSWPRGIWPGFAISLGFAYGPLLFAYTKSLAFKVPALATADFRHAAAPAASIILFFSANISVLWFAIGIFLSLGSYGIASYRLILKYRAILSETRSEYDQIALGWLSLLLLMQIALLAFNIVSVGLSFSGFPIMGAWAELVLFAGLLLFVNLIVFKGLQHPDLFAGVTTEDEAISDSGSPNTLTTQEAQRLFDQIESHMKSAQPFLNPGLTLKMLARQLTQTTRATSQAINIVAGRNFSDYVNSHRIEYAKSLLLDEREALSIMDVMLQSGFNTKSNFNRSFKQNTGQSPQAFRQAIRQAKT